jgi:hypothetical protein
MRLSTSVAILALAACASASPAPTPPAPTAAPKPAPTTAAAHELAALKGKLMSADYRSDLPELGKLRDEVKRYKADAEVGYLACYWSGFASWRLAVNGLNQDMREDELRQHLLHAAADMYSAIKLRDDFADAYAAAAGINGWIIGSMLRTKDDQDRVAEHATLAMMLLGRAKALDADNPRVLWIEGGFQLILGPERGGGQQVALATLEKMVAITERARVDPQSPTPDWGRPEALMMVANAHLAGKPPDVAAARKAAQAALALEPDWSYVRDKLIPKIDATKP